MQLRYLYVGVVDTEVALGQWRAARPSASLRWRFRAFGADVVALDVGAEPTVLLADHRPDGTTLPIYAVDDLDLWAGRLATWGWEVADDHSGTPEGPSVVCSLASGVQLALLRVDRPDAMDVAYADPANASAVRPGPVTGGAAAPTTPGRRP